MASRYVSLMQQNLVSCARPARTHPAVRHLGADDFRDTYAYATVVLETTRPTPDVNVYRQMSECLEQVVESLEQQLNAPPSPEDPSKTHFDFATLKAARVHYAAARDLAGE